MNCYDTITSQNYFRHNDNIQIQREGLPMGAPSSGLISELFLQHIEHLHLTHLKTKLKITEYFRYVDDILLIYDSNHTNIQTKLNDFNTIHHNLEFTAEIETDNNINFLDINIHRNPSNWNISIYRKPTFTDTLIPHSSNHPAQHKFAAVRFLHNRPNTYDLSTEAYEVEKQTIQNILANNSFPNGLLNTSSIKTRIHTAQDQLEKQKWATFTYTGKETIYITNIFKKTNIKIAFRTQNTTGNRLTPKHRTPDIYA
jgi:hypothetical protein